jgi:hypothetical protein
MRHSTFRKPRRSSASTSIGAAVVTVGLLSIAFSYAITRFTSNQPYTIHTVWKDAVRFGNLLHGSPHSRGPVIYPYSIIPGGVHSLAELERAIARDPVVAAQYANFDLAKFRVIKLKKDQYAYVSYRIGGDVFWTKKKLKLCKGETVFTDGQYYARTRCGNQLSEIPQPAVWSQEPSDEVLNTPAAPSGEPETEAFAAVLPGPAGAGNSFTPGGPIQLPPPGDTTTTTPPPTTPFVPLVPPPPICGNGGCNESIPPVPPPSPAPENSTLVLMGSGIIALAICLLRRRKAALAAAVNNRQD